MNLVLLLLITLTFPACGDRLSQGDLDRVLRASWQSYRQQFISPEGRVLIPERDGGTISEAQAYALLRAAWAGDESTFALVYAWTRQNMSRPDHLLSWHWGRRPDGTWGLVDANTASDGDLDYALALVLAERRGWRAPMGLPPYQAEARQVLAGILEKEVAALPDGTRLLTPGNWHDPGPPYLLNPSYFSPAAYRLFAQIRMSHPHAHGLKIPPAPLLQRGVQSPPLPKGDLGGFEFFAVKQVTPPPPAVPGQAGAPVLHSPSGGGEWDWLHRNTYQLLGRLSQGLGEDSGVGLFPDWCRIDAAGRLSPAPGRETQFGWEAVRLPWRLALDHLWFGEPRAAQILGPRFLPFFKQEWQSKGRLAAVYNFDGAPAADFESPVLYAGVLAAALTTGDREFARLMAEKIMTLYHEKDGRAYFVSPDNYYANNWAWLGLAMYAGWLKP